MYSVVLILKSSYAIASRKGRKPRLAGLRRGDDKHILLVELPHHSQRVTRKMGNASKSFVELG